MPLLYPIKIEYRDKLVVGLISPHLKIDFINQYIEFTKKSSASLAPRTEDLELESLQIVVENYITWLKSNDYVIRMPGHSRIEAFQRGEQWIYVQPNILIEEGPLERVTKIAGICLFMSTSALGEFFFVMAARFDKVAYTELILPIISDFTMATVIYVYSGTASNVAIKGKELDDWWSNKKYSPTEIELSEKYPIFSSWTLSRTMLTALPLVYTIFKYIGYWQSMMSMRDKIEASDLEDPIISPKFVYNLAIVGTTIGALYTIAQCTSLSFQATNNVKIFLDKCYEICSNKLKHIGNRGYVEVLTTDEEITDIDAPNAMNDDDKIASLSPFEIDKQIAINGKEPSNVHTIFLLGEITYNNLLLNRQDLLHEVIQIGGSKAVQVMINLGEDVEVANMIIECIEQYGTKHVVNIFFDYTTKDPTPKYFVKETLQIKDATELTAEHIFFLDTEKGVEFVQSIANNFNQEILFMALELGKDQSIAEQILLEVEIQGIDMVISTLLGKKLSIVNTVTDNIENIIGTEELNKLQLIPQGMLNPWSSKVYQKIMEYIDGLAKNLDDLLNMGKSGDQVTITLMILENFLEFSASGQRVMGSGRKPYYDPSDDHGWSYGAEDDNNNSYVEATEHQGEFVGLLLPLFNNSTDDNLHHYY